ncbi:unnamed protein product [Linum trigynum]|uniref:Amidohydrolase 3 domain-containing protein n=1 Tax=Linum trigynum TaxID=586398 RepID=A0AAV2F8Y2_9ROSI
MNLVVILSASIALGLAVLYLPLLKLSPPFDFRLSSSKSANQVPFAELVLKNGVIFTSDSSLPFADSMAVRNGRILGVGNYSSLQGLIGNDTQELNLQEKVVVPGFIDSHVHFIPGGLQMARVELRGVNQKAEFINRVKEAVTKLPQGSWVLWSLVISLVFDV